MSYDPGALKLYVDGNSYKNPGGAGGFACVAEYPESCNRPDELLFEEGFYETTINRMELTACIRALEYIAKEAASLGVDRVLVVTDSLYVSESHRRAQLWRKNGWRNSSGRPIENSDLWKRFLSIRQRIRIRTEIVWKKGKKSPILKAVDRAAKAAGKNPSKSDRGFRGGKVGRSNVIGGSSSLYDAKGQQDVIRVYRTALIRKADHKIYFDVSRDGVGTFAQKSNAYALPEVAHELHRGHCYRVQFNADPRYPFIQEVIEEVPCGLIETVAGV